MKILLATDGSKFSQVAAEAVAAQVTPKRDQVRVIHVVDILTGPIPDMMAYYPGIEHGRDAQRKIAQEIVSEAAESLRSAHLCVTSDIEWGIPKSKIIDVAAEWPADLIVLGSHGKTGLVRFLTGSVADAVMRHAHCSVEIVRVPPLNEVANHSGASRNGRSTRILLAVDDTEFSQAAARLLGEQIVLPRTEVRVLYVVEPPNLLVAREMGGYDPALERVWKIQIEQAEGLVAKVAETFCGKAQTVTTSVVQGDPRSEILEQAEHWKASLIVIGSHGRTGFARFLMGSVSDAVARHSHCSVEVVRVGSLD